MKLTGLKTNTRSVRKMHHHRQAMDGAPAVFVVIAGRI
jgi:hypothetical protein